MTTADFAPETASNIALARHFLSINQPQRVLDILSHLNSADLENWEFWYIRGRALYQLERFDEAFNTAQTGLSKEPEAISLLYLLCNLYAERDNLAMAETLILKTLRQDPENPVLLCRYAELLSQGNQLDKATRLVNEAARLAPTHPYVAQTRATLAYLQGNDKMVMQHSRKILADDPEDTYGHYMLGASLSNAGDIQGAEQQFRTAARLNPESPGVTHTAREARFQVHPLLWPLLPAYRLGTIRIWIGAIITLVALTMLGYSQAASIFAWVYLGYCVYSWVVPPLLRWWLRRRAQK